MNKVVTVNKAADKATIALENLKSTINNLLEDSYIAVGFPECQKYTEIYGSEIAYDPKKNLWFIPIKYYYGK